MCELACACGSVSAEIQHILEKSAEIGSRWYDGDMVVTQAYYVPGEQNG